MLELTQGTIENFFQSLINTLDELENISGLKLKSKGLNHAGDTTYKTQSYPYNIMTKRQLM